MHGRRREEPDVQARPFVPSGEPGPALNLARAQWRGRILEEAVGHARSSGGSGWADHGGKRMGRPGDILEEADRNARPPRLSGLSSKQLAGVGMVLEPEDPGMDGSCHVTHLSPQGPLAACGQVCVNDQLVAVDGRCVIGLLRSHIKSLVLGRYVSVAHAS